MLRIIYTTSQIFEFFLNNTNLTFLAFLYTAIRWIEKSLNWTWIISGSIEHDFIRIWKSETITDWQIGWVSKAVRNVIYRWLVLWVRFPVEATLFLMVLKPLDVNFVQKCQKCQICVVLYRKNSSVHVLRKALIETSTNWDRTENRTFNQFPLF